MLRLNIKREPYQLDFTPEIGVKVRPMNAALFAAAQAEAIRRVSEFREEHDGNPDARELEEFTAKALNAAIARRAIIEWWGISMPDPSNPEDPGKDKPAELTPQNIDAAMDVAEFYLWFQRVYSTQGSATAFEGNALRPAPDGTGGAGPNSADRASKAEPHAQAEVA